MNIKNTLVVYATPTSSEQKKTISSVKSALKKCRIKHAIVHRGKLGKKSFENRDLAIAVGGDGTFLNTAHFIFSNMHILGVNSDPKFKEGFFMAASRKDFEKKFNRILDGDYKIRKLSRLEAYINGKKVPELALNEFYISRVKEYRTARYYIAITRMKERQKSSGIIISTAAGSHAWMKSAGGKTLPIDSNKFEYLVREPYCGRISAKCQLVNGILDKNDKLEIGFELGKGILIADSLSREHKFRAGQKIIVKVSEKPLYSIMF